MIPIAEEPVQKTKLYPTNGSFMFSEWYLHKDGEITGPFDTKTLCNMYEHKKTEKDLTVSNKDTAQSYPLDLLRKHYKELQRHDIQKPMSEIKSKTEKTEKIDTKSNALNSVDYEHMILRGRLRLGEKINPYSLAFLYIPLTLGLYWISWYNKTATSIIQHLDHPNGDALLKPRWLILIPGYHMLMVFRLAKLLLQMEVQNKYRFTSPTLAFFLSICPPLAIFYIQKALNLHWTLHAKHSLHLKNSSYKI